MPLHVQLLRFIQTSFTTTTIWAKLLLKIKTTSNTFLTQSYKTRNKSQTCFWVNSHKRWLAQNYFQIFKFVFSCLLSGEQRILSNAWKNLFKWDIFKTINDGLSLLIPIHSCSTWKTNWPISKKYSEAKICRCHLQNEPYLQKCLCYKHDLGVILKFSLKLFTWYRVSKNVLYPKMQNFKNFYYNKDNRIWYFDLF